MRATNCLRRFQKDKRGAIAIEFGILVSVLIGILFSAVEYSRYILVQHKAEKSTAAVGDMVSQYTVIQTGDLKEIFKAASQILSHYEVKGQGLLIVSHIHAAQKNNPKITWQEFSSTSLARKSKLGAVGDTPKLPAGFTMDDGETVVAVESFIHFEPMLFDLVVTGKDIYRIAWYHPRKADQIAYNKTGNAQIDAKECGTIQAGVKVGGGTGLLLCVGN